MWLLAQAANAIGGYTKLSPLLWASILGMGIGNVIGADGKKRLGAGVGFAKSRLLRAGIVLYGFKLTVQQIASIGIAGVLADLFTISSTMFLAITVGVRGLGLAPSLASLIGVGAAICGCTAAAAAQPVVDGEDYETAAAVGTVVFCGTLAMFLYPALFKLVPFLNADHRLMGIFTGSTVHELAGVVAASTAMPADVAAVAVVTKLVRVALLAPMLVLMSTFPALWGKGGSNGDSGSSGDGTKVVKPPLPYFALGFLGAAVLNSLVTLDRGLVKVSVKASALCLAMAMSALGLEADLAKIRALGSKPLLLAAGLWAWLLFACGSVARLLVHVFPI